MKAYRFEVQVYASVLEYTHHMGSAQQRVYIPEVGVLGYRENESFDFFSGEADALADGQHMLEGKVDGCELLGEFEIDRAGIETLVSDVAKAQAEMAEAKKRFGWLGNELVAA